MTLAAPDTIYALATPPGRGGVAVVRVSGLRARDAIAALTQMSAPPPRLASLRRLADPQSGQLIDKALILYFAAPASFTGEDVAEFHLHGGPAVCDALLSALSALPGLTMAEPGAFTRRAFENGKMDLTAAEAVADLIDAQTQAQKNQALAQMDGALAQLYDGWRERLTRALAYLEASIDFPDEDLPADVAAKVRPALQELHKEIGAHLADGRRGEILRDGIHVAVIGAPNAGKSSLVNKLAQRDVAIVSAQAGTTRDIIETHLDIGGYPVILSDTAGLRPDQLGDKGQDAIESEGIRRALQRARDADIRILLFDATALPSLDKHTQALADEHSLIIFNKSDLSKSAAKPFPDALFISAQSGAGLDRLTIALRDKIKTLLGTRAAPPPTRRRHREALAHTLDSLTRALNGAEPELIGEDIRLATRHLGRITGRVDVEDLLDVIFRDFCIGK